MTSAKTALALLSAVLFAAGCKSHLDPDAVRNADLYFLPRFRYEDRPLYAFTPEERERALQEHRKLGSNILFEFVIDKEGQVVKVRFVQTYEPEHRHADILAHARRMVFTRDSEGDRYRTFYFPTKYNAQYEFDWMNN